MPVEVVITGNGRYAGARSAIDDYEVLEEATAIQASDSSGGTGQISFGAVDDPSRGGSLLLLNDTVSLTDGARGTTEGKINDINGVEGILSVTADSRLGRLVIDRTSPGVNGTFADAINQYLALGGITTGIGIDATLATIPVVIPGWTGDLWRKINELLVAYGAEITLIRGQVVVRKVRTLKALEINNIRPTWRVSNSELAQQVEVAYYNTQYRTNALVYPQGGWTDAVTVYSVEAGQTLTVNLPVDITLKSLIQPTAVNNVAQLYAGPSSMYSVVGSDGTAILATEWTAGGGFISVAIGADGKSIDATIRGAQGSISQYSPFRIAVTRGVNDYYSSLRISGTGIHYARKTVVVPTGADDQVTSRVIGTTVDNVHVATESQARSLALDVASAWATPRRTLNIKKVSVNKPRETQQNTDYATFADFDVDYATLSFAQFDALFAGKTFTDFDKTYYDKVANKFDFQVFGNANGSRFQWRRNMFRIRQARIRAGEVDLEAEVDTTVGDFDASTPFTPQYTWTERRRNLFPDPLGKNLSDAIWTPPTGATKSLVTDMTGGVPTAVRFTRTGAAGTTLGIRLAVGTTMPKATVIRLRARVRSTAELSVSVRSRPAVTSATGESVLGNIVIPAGDSEIDLTGGTFGSAQTTTATSGIIFVYTSGNPGDRLDLSNVTLEVAAGTTDPPTKPFSGSSPNGPGYRTRWLGAVDGSQSVYETSAQTGVAAMTFSSFDEMYAGMTFEDFSLIPLPNVLPEYDRT